MHVCVSSLCQLHRKADSACPSAESCDVLPNLCIPLLGSQAWMVRKANQPRRAKTGLRQLLTAKRADSCCSGDTKNRKTAAYLKVPASPAGFSSLVKMRMRLLALLLAADSS